MNRFIYGLPYDFIQQNGFYLVIDLGEDDGERLSPLALNMLRSVTVPRLLPVRVEQWNLNRKLYYNIHSKRMLSPLLNGKHLQKQDFMRLLMNIVRTLEDSKLYMLNEAHYILHDEFMFIGKDPGDIYFTYLPLKTAEELPSLKDQLLGLFRAFSEKLENAEDWGIPEFLRLLEREEFHISELRAALEHVSFRGCRLADPQRPADGGQANRPAEREAGACTRQHHLADWKQGELSDLLGEDRNTDEVCNTDEPQQSAMEPRQSVIRKKVNRDPKKKEAVELSLKENLLLLSLVSALLALLWSRFAEQPSEGWFYVHAGVSLLLCDAAFVFSKIWRPSFVERLRNRQNRSGRGNRYAAPERAEHTEEEVSGKSSDPSPKGTATTDASPHLFDAAFVSASMADSPLTAEEGSYGVKPGKSARYYDDLAQKTTLLVSAPPTVILSDSYRTKAPKETDMFRKKVFLEIRKSGLVEKVAVESDQRFLIGRGPDGVHYVYDDPGVSRTHLEIVSGQDGCSARDLGSRNGSFLNGEPMVPYKWYTFGENDVISVIHAELRMSASGRLSSGAGITPHAANPIEKVRKTV